MRETFSYGNEPSRNLSTAENKGVVSFAEELRRFEQVFLDVFAQMLEREGTVLKDFDFGGARSLSQAREYVNLLASILERSLDTASSEDERQAISEAIQKLRSEYEAASLAVKSDKTIQEIRKYLDGLGGYMGDRETLVRFIPETQKPLAQELVDIVEQTANTYQANDEEREMLLRQVRYVMLRLPNWVRDEDELIRYLDDSLSDFLLRHRQEERDTYHGRPKRFVG